MVLPYTSKHLKTNIFSSTEIRTSIREMESVVRVCESIQYAVKSLWRIQAFVIEYVTGSFEWLCFLSKESKDLLATKRGKSFFVSFVVVLFERIS